MDRRHAAALVIALALAACSDPGTTDPDRPAASSVTTSEEASALGALDTAAQQGVDPATLAVTRFALLFGDVPGALPIAADDSLPLSGTGAVTAVAEVWDELDDGQRTAVRDHLEPWRAALVDTTGMVDALAAGGEDGGEGTVIAMGAGPVVLAEAPDDDVVTALRDAGAHVLGVLGGQRPTGVLVQQSGEPLDEGDAVTHAGVLTLLPGVAEIIFDDTVTGRDCRMILGPVVPTLPEPMLRSLAAHEMFHCWSIVNAPNLSGHNATPDWYQEGVAAWLGEQYAGGSDYSTNWWRLWLLPSSRSVTSTSYPAIGFWSWVDAAAGGDLLEQVPALHEVAITGDDRALYGAVLQALDDEVVTGLGASRSRRPDWGARWELTGPGITDVSVDAEPPLALSVGTTTLDTRAGELRTGTYRRPAGPGLLGLRLTAQGHVRARWSGGTEAVAAGHDQDVRWCLDDRCECPDGTALLGWEPLPAEAEVLTVAATGATDLGATATMAVEPLCEDATPSPPTSIDDDGPLLGTWRSQPSAVMAELNTLFADLFADATYMGGDVVVTFAADGTMDVTYEDVLVRLRSEPDGPGVPMEISGGGTLDYTVEGSTMTFSGRDWEVRFRIAGVDGNLPIADEDIGRGPPATAVWGIHQGTLTLQVDTSDVFLPNQYRKR